jgi:hypothetical protein
VANPRIPEPGTAIRLDVVGMLIRMSIQAAGKLKSSSRNISFV